jgi:predicted Zn finger-like uncharacterized protein
MSSITCCPACRTYFKIVPDQLRISQGWVRCGQCAEVFDATMQMLPTSHDEQANTDVSVERLDTSEVGFHPDVLEVISAEQAQPLAEATSQSSISFLQGQETNTLWQKPLVRVLLGLFIFVLSISLSVQLIVSERDFIAAMKPELKPWLLMLCEPLHCSIQPLRKINSLVIESSSFTKVRADSYRLNLTIKNADVLVLAMPEVELVLTDSLDQPIVRRVLRASELGAPQNTLQPNAEWSTSLTIVVKPNNLIDRIAGYRLLAFYP